MLQGLVSGSCPGDAGGTASPCQLPDLVETGLTGRVPGRAPGDRVLGDPTGVTTRGKGRVEVQAAWQPFIPSCRGAVGHRAGWGGEDKWHCRKILFNNLIRPKKKKKSPSWDSSGKETPASAVIPSCWPGRGVFLGKQVEQPSSRSAGTSGASPARRELPQSPGEGLSWKAVCRQLAQGCSPARSPSAQSHPGGAGERAPVPSRDWWYQA